MTDDEDLTAAFGERHECEYCGNARYPDYVKGTGDDRKCWCSHWCKYRDEGEIPDWMPDYGPVRI